MKEKLSFVGSRLEAVLKANGGNYLVGESLTYADILTAHAVTWYVEECGPDVVADMPNLVKLQNTVIALRGVNGFIRSSAFYPISDKKYVNQVCLVLDRSI
jgi:glutathione S-transferase